MRQVRGRISHRRPVVNQCVGECGGFFHVEGKKGVGVHLRAVVPTHKAAHGGGRCLQVHRVAVVIHAAAEHGSLGRVVAQPPHRAGGAGAVKGVGLQSHNGRLIGGEIVAGRGEQREREIAVAQAVETPVEMEKAVRVVLIAYKLVPHRAVFALIKHRPVAVELVPDEALPLVVREGLAFHPLQAGGVFEIGVHGIFGAGVIQPIGALARLRPAAAVGGGVEHHSHRHRTVVHQCRHGGNLGLAARCRQRGRHICPVVSRRTEVGALLPIVERVV